MDEEAIFASKFQRRTKILRNKVDRCLCPSMEISLEQWFREMRAKDACVDGNNLRSKAREIYHNIHPIGPSPEKGNSKC